MLLPWTRTASDHLAATADMLIYTDCEEILDVHNALTLVAQVSPHWPVRAGVVGGVDAATVGWEWGA